ncbi:hypothetical protein COD78_28310, partial [Bacillus cereus]|uniref:metallophosphoesterase n=1 Tax=Bacillus cereus TaxID=1396 RepID=UPI000BF8FBDE
MSSLKTNQKNVSKILQSLVITSDPQYPWTPKMDEPGGSNESEDEKKRVSENLIKEQYNNISSYIKSNRACPVLINGDITAFGHPWQREKMEELLKKINVRHFYGLGNHDIENNYNQCWQNQCTGDSLLDYINHVDDIPTVFLHSKDITRKGSGSFVTYSGSFAYSLVFDEIYSIQLNNYPTMEMNFVAGNRTQYKMKSTLDWLENELKKATHLGKIIIVNVHKPNDWKGGPSERFIRLLKNYDVKAVFCGHYHKKVGIQHSYRDYFGDVPVFLSGSASQRSYLILEQTAKELMIYSVRNNNWEEKKLESRIELNIMPRGTYQIKTALNNNSVVDLNVSDNDVTLYNNHYGDNQRWFFSYDGNKGAYQILSEKFPILVLAWNDIPGSRDVFATLNEGKEEHYWVLEDVGNDYYIIKNKKNPNLVLNVEDGKTASGTNINVHEKNGD